MKTLSIAAAAATALLLAACSGGSDAGNNSSEGTAGVQVQEQTPDNLQEDPQNAVVPIGTPHGAPAPAATASPIAALPADFHGRWGMVPNDCVPGRADAKGLMIVSTDGLGFYELRAKIERIVPTGAMMTVDLAFTGEGQEWNRRETLTLLDGGRTLVREEQQPAGSFRYSRCPAGKESNA